MRCLKSIICLFFVQLVLVIFPLTLMGEAPVSQKSEKGNQEKETKIDQAAMWHKKGYDFYKKKEYSAAIDCLKKAIKLNPVEVVYIINLAETNTNIDRFDAARQLLEESLKKFSGKEDRKKLQIELADVHFWWAKSFEKKYDHANAIEHYKKAYEINKVYRSKKAAIDLNNIGFVYSDIGQKQKAMDYYEKALILRRAVGDRAGEATTLNNMGIVCFSRGQKQKALEYYKKALTLRRAVIDRVGEAKTLINMGVVYSDCGQKQEALEYYKKALSLFQAEENKTGEATSLNNIGLLYFDLGQYQEALDYYKKALSISRVVGDRIGEAKILVNLGEVCSARGQKQEALDYFHKVLPIFCAIGNRKGEVTTINNIGSVYSDSNLYQKALEYYHKALKISQEIEDKTAEATILNNIGIVYGDLCQYQKALDYYEKALTIRRIMGDRTGEASILNNFGRVYSALGQNQKALEYFLKVLPIDQEIGTRAGEATTLNNIGFAYFNLGQKQKALGYYEKALPLSRVVEDHAGEATTLNNIGGVYHTLGQNQKALGYYEKALPLRRSVGDRSGEATTLNNIGGMYYNLGQKQKALEYYEKALPIRRTVEDHAGEATTLSNIMFCWDSLKNSYLSIYYGKRSVNASQNLRAFITGLKKEFQKSYLETKKHTYRHLTNFLIKEGRISEAQIVLDMLKIEEYRDFIRRDPSSFEFPSVQIDFTPFEDQWLIKFNTIMDKFSGISNEYHVLKFKKNKNDAEKKRMEELDSELKKSTKAYGNFLTQMKDAFVKHEKEIKEGKPDPDAIAKKASALQETLKYLDENERSKNAALHYLVFGSRISVIITTPSEQVVKQTEIDEKGFNLLIMNYRNFILKSGKEMRTAKNIKTSTDTEKQKNPYEKKLYDIIFRPVEEELKKYGATNLMISLDGVLRYVPLGILWDGENYLVQRYRVTVITPSSLKNIKAVPVQKKKILGLGASRGGHGFKHLPYVRKEIQAIVNDKEKGYNGLIQGKAFIDHDFTKNTMLKELEKKDYPLVHISSHFKFSPGDETKNFLLLGDSNVIKLSEIRRMGKLFDNVKLLVLSACQTGVGGNGEEIDGFGELAQQSGAKSVVASLWSVEDESTKDLMVAFYRIMKKAGVTSKIEALRQAQLELAGLEDLLQKTQKQRVRSKTKYSHPYYWGPFIMIGNWR